MPVKANRDELRQQVLGATRSCLEEGMRPSNAELRRRGVHGNDTVLFKIRHQLIEAGELPACSMGTGRMLHRCYAKRTIDPPSSRDVPEIPFTMLMVRMYGRKKLLRQYQRRVEPIATIQRRRSS